MISERDPLSLAVADTRPVMGLGGIPHKTAVLLVVVGAGLFIISPTPLIAGLLQIPLVLVFIVIAAMVRYDPNKPRVFMKWLLTKALDMATAVWGGASCTPWPDRANPHRGIWR